MRKDFYELLSAFTSHEIDEDKFFISGPTAIDGNITKVTIEPKGDSNIYGKRTVQYKRYDLSSELPQTLIFRGEKTFYELLVQLKNKCFFTYKRFDKPVGGVVVPRFLRLANYDFDDRVLPVIFSQTLELRLPVAARSDFFIGELTFLIKPS